MVPGERGRPWFMPLGSSNKAKNARGARTSRQAAGGNMQNRKKIRIPPLNKLPAVVNMDFMFMFNGEKEPELMMSSPLRPLI